jgi:hypothetical protein
VIPVPEVIGAATRGAPRRVHDRSIASSGLKMTVSQSWSFFQRPEQIKSIAAAPGWIAWGAARYR